MTADSARFVASGQQRLITAVLVGSGGTMIAVGLVLFLSGFEPSTIAMVLVAAGVADIGLFAFWGRKLPARRTVVIDAEGIHVVPDSGAAVLLPWRDIRSWNVGQPVTGTSGNTPANRSLLAQPAEHVLEPPAETRPYWLADAACWRVCRIAEISGSEQDVITALRTHAPHLDQQNAGTNGG